MILIEAAWRHDMWNLFMGASAFLFFFKKKVMAFVN